MSLLDLLGMVQVLWNGAPINPTRDKINFVGGAVADNGVLEATDITLTPAASGIPNDSSVTGSTVKDALNTLKSSVTALVTGVSSVYGRTGAVVAMLGDYPASKISNDSGVSGSTVKAALDVLAAAIVGAGVATVFGRSGMVVAVLGDYAAGLISNDSSVSGATVKDALNALVPSSFEAYAGTIAGNIDNPGTTWTDYSTLGAMTDSVQVGITRSSNLYTVTQGGYYFATITAVLFVDDVFGSAAPIHAIRLRNDTAGATLLQQSHNPLGVQSQTSHSARSMTVSGLVHLAAGDAVRVQGVLNTSKSATYTAATLDGESEHTFNFSLVRLG